ncbi:MAG TPA: hypothetical protein VGF92_08785 [Stellaceae bacterium]
MKVKLVQPEEWEGVEFEETPHDEADEGEGEEDQDETEAASGEDDDEDEADEDEGEDEDESEDEKGGSSDRAGALAARIETATEQLKKIAALLAAYPEIRPALVKATTSLSDARKQLGAKAFDEVEKLLHGAQTAMADAAHLIKGGPGPTENHEAETDEDEEEEAPSHLKVPSKPLLPIWVQAKEQADAEIGKLQEKLRAVGDEDLTQIAEYGLYGATTGQAAKLMAALRDADSSKSPDALKKLYVAANSYADYMDGAGSDLFDLIEQNEFHAVRLRSILGPALAAITKELAG